MEEGRVSSLEEILGRLAIYENIERVFSQDWIMTEYRKGELHPLLRLLSIRDETVESLLRDLDTYIGTLSNYNGIAQVLQSLRDRNAFWQILSELEIYSKFCKQDNFKLNPKIYNEKNPDFSFEINGRVFYAEIYTPTESKSRVEGEIGNSTTNITLLLMKKLSQHFSHAIESKTIPQNSSFILFINTSHAFVDKFDVDIAFSGTPYIKLCRDKITKRAEGAYVTNMDDSINQTYEDAKLLSAVVLYSRDASWELIHNLRAINLIASEEESLIMHICGGRDLNPRRH